MAEIHRLLDDVRKEWGALSWEGTFEEYLNMVIAKPELARYSHARIYDMVQWAGALPGRDGVPEYKLFAGEIFGLDRALDRLVQFFHAGARGLEVRKRILLLMGPPASGKSSTVNLIKQGLERYSRTDHGATYAIKGCPMQEEPLHLIPEERRQELARDYGLHIEGDLCPRCRYNLGHEYAGDIAKVMVHRIEFSQSVGVGMGSFVATSSESQDISRLTGSVDMSYLTVDRLEGAGKGLRLDGELQAANRGLMEFIEIFKSDERFLTVILGVTQEQVIKLGSIGSVYADEAIIAHSNEEEYDAFANNKETAALLDRLILVKMPYNLRVSDEVKIYSKLLAEGHASCLVKSEVHAGIAPLSLHVAAVMSVLSRLEVAGRDSGLSRLSLVDKMKLYDGYVLPPYTRSDVERLLESSPREGMVGLSPRYVINRLADAMAREKGCITPPKTLRSLMEGLEERAGVSKEERDRISVLVKDVVRDYQDRAVREVQRAATEDFHEKVADLFQSYVRDAESYCIGQRAGTTQAVPPDERLLRKVEGALNLRDAERLRFRLEVCDTYSYLRQRPDMPGRRYESLPTLHMAIEDLLFPGRSEIKLAIDPRRKDHGPGLNRGELIERLVSRHGYCEECAQDLVDFVWKTLQGKEAISLQRGKVSW